MMRITLALPVLILGSSASGREDAAGLLRCFPCADWSRHFQSFRHAERIAPARRSDIGQAVFIVFYKQSCSKNEQEGDAKSNSVAQALVDFRDRIGNDAAYLPVEVEGGTSRNRQKV
jgi:hypothetical protein